MKSLAIAFFLILALLAAPSSVLFAQWVQTNSPNGGVVFSFAVSDTNLFAGTFGGGVFLSTNNGASWTAVNSGLTNTYVRSLAVSGTNLFAGTDGGVFLSTNNGTSWTAVNSGLTNTYVYSLAVCGTNLFAGTFGGGVFLSTNNGASWTAVNSGLTNTYVRSLAVSGTKLFAGTAGGSVLSTNNGTSWAAVNSGLTNTNVWSLAVSGTNLFAGTWDGGVFLSTNNGTSWTAVNSGLTNTHVRSLAVSGTSLFAGTAGNGVFLSTNNGTSWAAVNSGLTNTNVWSLAVSGTNLFAGTWDSGVWRRPLSEIANPPPVAAVTKSFFTPTSGRTSFQDSENETAVDIAVGSESGGATIHVKRYAVPPTDSGSITGNVSVYHWIIQQTGLAATFNAEVRFNISQIPNNGIVDPATVYIFRRPTPGSGPFTQLTSTHVAGELVASGDASAFFGEFAFGSANNPLPIILASFSVQMNPNGPGMLLEWTTISEINNYGFYVQRRLIGAEQWFEIPNSFIAGHGTTTEPRGYSFIDGTVPPGSLQYRLKQVDLDGTVHLTEPVQINSVTNASERGTLPHEFSMSQNYPNPFNPATTISFSLPAKSFVSLKVFDALGREVSALISGELTAGTYSQKLDAAGLTSGVYFYRLQAGSFVETKKLLLLR